MQNQSVLQSRTETANNLPYLDGMRGMAILLVAGGHIFCEIYLCKISWIGLNLFFVLSGYLITCTLFRYRLYSTRNYFRNFYVRRILRIFPLYYGVLAFFFLLLPLISQRLNAHYSGLDTIQGSYWFYTSNWNIIANGLPHQPIFFHFWSLAVEEQFYFIWPLLFLICSSSKGKYILISVLLGLSVSNRIMTETPLNAYLSSFTAAEPLLLGCLLCILQQDGILQRIMKKLNIAACLSAGFLCIVFLRDQDLHITNTWLMKYGYSAINIIIIAMVAAALVGHYGGKQVRKFFSMNWLRWLGKYSYSIYVFHWIILQTVVYKLQAVLIANHFMAPLAYPLARITGIALTLIISYCSYNYFESYFLSLKRYFSEDKSWKSKFKWGYFFHRQAKPVQP